MEMGKEKLQNLKLKLKNIKFKRPNLKEIDYKKILNNKNTYYIAGGVLVVCLMILGSMPKRGIDWFALWSQLRVSDGGDCADEKRRSQRGGDKSHTYNEAEIRGLRNRRMIYRDISMILDMMADARTEMAR